MVLFALVLLDQYVGTCYRAVRNTEFRSYQWDSETLWELQPEFTGSAFGHIVHTNSAGFRGTEPLAPKSSNSFRIITFGDSRTYGIHVADQETFSHVLQTELKKQQIDAQVLNSGTPGYTAVQCLAKLKQLLKFQPDIAILAVGYNDRRYLVLTSPDSPENFRQIAALRRGMQILGISNIFFAITHELGSNALKKKLESPPPLDQVRVRVSPDRFSSSVEEFLLLCKKNGIQPLLLKIPQNPLVFVPVEQAYALYKQQQYTEAISLLKEKQPELHVAAQAFAHYTMGVCYRALNDESQAQKHFKAHSPLGSLHGESVLRPQAEYLERSQKLAEKYSVPVLDAQEYILKINEYLSNSEIHSLLDEVEAADFPLVDGTTPLHRENGKILNLENFLHARYTDECHFDALGHALIGKGLSVEILNLLDISHRK
jgi:lysophospholipase L1-like esterase